MADPADLVDPYPPPAEVAGLPINRKPREWYKTLERATLPRNWAEFGVAGGRNIRKFMRPKAAGRTIYAFDSWQGLPEDWTRGGNKSMRPKGSFSCPQPKLDGPIQFIPGWFADTLPAWSMTAPPLGFISLDADIYSSTITVLRAINHLIGPGTVIRFDEFQGYEQYGEHEVRAYREWIAEFDREAKFFVRSVYGASCVVTK